MTCDHASNLISARIDGELGAAEGAALDAHLAECASCRAAAEAMELQDAALLRAFAPRRAAAAALAERVALELSRGTPAPAPPRPTRASTRLIRWAGLAGAVAAGVVVAVVLHRPGGSPAVPPPPVVRLTLATGEVFACPTEGDGWRPLSPGEAVPAGGRVRTAGASKCELRLTDGTPVRLDAATEACFADGKDVRVASGQFWSAVAGGATPIRVTAGKTTVTAGGKDEPAGTRLELSRATDRTTVTVLSGAASVAGQGTPATVRGGECLDVPTGPGSLSCVPLADPLQATRWQDELLVLKPGDDPEVAARVGQLLARISSERAAATTRPGPVEEDVRARGQAWSAPMACYVCGRPGAVPPGERRTAAGLLADLAPAWCIPDLIELLGDEDGQVRFHAAVALRRLTGRDLGYPPDRCAAAREGAALAAWKSWWEANKVRYPRAK